MQHKSAHLRVRLCVRTRWITAIQIGEVICFVSSRLVFCFWEISRILAWKCLKMTSPIALDINSSLNLQYWLNAFFFISFNSQENFESFVVVGFSLHLFPPCSGICMSVSNVLFCFVVPQNTITPIYRIYITRFANDCYYCFHFNKIKRFSCWWFLLEMNENQSCEQKTPTKTGFSGSG